jgi:hypothetical protein
VAIGTSQAFAKLHVQGYGYIGAASSVRAWFSWATGQSSDRVQRGNGGWTNAGIYAQNDVITSGTIASLAGAITGSDKRIKKDVVDANDVSALETLRLLKPKKYKYVDEFNRGSEPVWGFIAQEVRDTLPYATQLQTECLPNIYELANVSNCNVITFTNFNTSNLESNSMVLKVYDEDDTEHLINIAEVVDEHSVRVDEDLSNDKIFVYGQQVDDFVYLQKDAIWTVATSALQEVDRQLQAEKARNDALEARISALENA